MLLNDVKIKPDKSVKGILKVFGQELKALQMDLYDTLLQLLTSVCVRVCVVVCKSGERYLTCLSVSRWGGSSV